MSGYKPDHHAPYEFPPECRALVEQHLLERDRLEQRLAALERREAELEKKISMWEDRAGFMRSAIIKVASASMALAAGYEWFRTHFELR